MIGYPHVAEGVSSGVAVITEMTYTFALVLVVLHTATTKKQEGNSFFGLAIGKSYYYKPQN
jgi:aquaporin Z